MFGNLIYKIKRNNRVKDCLKILIALMYFPKLIVAYIASKFYLHNKKNLWLISEMGIDAKDNGRDFFEFLRFQHPEIETAFILEKNSMEFASLNKIGHIIEPNSFEHFMAIFRSQYLISTHDHYVLPMKWVNWREFKLLYGWMVPNLKFVFLQHGVMQWDAKKNSNYKRTKFDYFITSTKSEYREISGYGYPKGNVIETGLPRFDKLDKSSSDAPTKRVILFSPTWRQYLANVSKSEFLESNYFKTINNVLNDKNLVNILKKNNVDFYFMPPHHEIQKFLNEFSAGSYHIKLISIDKMSLKKVLMESSLMITDYSSISMDFAYMERPVIYFQFDQEEFSKGHYTYSLDYFTHQRDGFGPVVSNEEDLIDGLIKIIKNNFNMDSYYKNRVNKFFDLRDNKNAQRLFEILKGEKND